MADEPTHPELDIPRDTADLPATLNLSSSGWTPTDVPDVGDMLDNCRLVARLGHGSSGHAFLAQQPALANRYVVLKVTDATHDEHLNLARLQHTNIMPLFWASTHPHNGLRVLAMPYLARTTLSALLDRLRATPIDTWDGRRAFVELQKDQDDLPVRIEPHEHPAQVLNESSWIDFVLRLGQTLAEALAFAHRARLLHLDVKPSNVMITPAGQPILLDLDVARQPVPAGATDVACFGGTQPYMSPEQRLALDALQQQQPVPIGVDARADVYALGVVLYEALGGVLDAEPRCDPERLPLLNPRVNREIVAIVARCMAEGPAARYPGARALALDLERQLNNLPLKGVRERWSDRWHKWRRRRPLALPLIVVFTGFCLATSSAGVSLLQIAADRQAQAETALLQGQDLLRQGQYDAAVRRLSAGQQLVVDLNTSRAQVLHEELSRRLHNARRLQQAEELHKLVRLLRYYAVEERAARRLQHVLEAAARIMWAARGLLTDRSSGVLERAVERQIDSNLQETMLLWCEMQMRLAPPSHVAAVRTQVHATIAQAQQLFGPVFAVKLAQQQHGLAAGGAHPVAATAWEHCALARLALARGDVAPARAELQKAHALGPLDPVVHFYLGVLALRQGRHAEALPAFSFCLGADPTPECFVLRGEAHAALGRHEDALRDYQQAIERGPELALAYRQRGLLYRELGRHEEAQADLQRAEQLGQ